MFHFPFKARKNDPEKEALHTQLRESERVKTAARINLVRSTRNLLKKLDDIAIEEAIEQIGVDMSKRN